MSVPPINPVAPESDAEYIAGRKMRRRRKALSVLLVRLLVVVGILVFWELASGSILNPFFFSSPSLIWGRFTELVLGGEIWPHLRVTLTEMMAGFVIGTLSGVFLGLLFGLIPFLARVFDPFIIAFYSLPKIAIAPLLILWFGIDMTPKIVLSAIIVFFIVFFNTLTGVKQVDRELVDVLRVMGANKIQMLWRVTIPSALTWIFVGLKVSVPYALVGAVTGELIASSRGVGALISRSAATFRTDGVFAALLVLMIITAFMDRLLDVLEKRWMRWRRDSDADNRI